MPYFLYGEQGKDDKLLSHLLFSSALTAVISFSFTVAMDMIDSLGNSPFNPFSKYVFPTSKISYGSAVSGGHKHQCLFKMQRKPGGSDWKLTLYAKIGFRVVHGSQVCVSFLLECNCGPISS